MKITPTKINDILMIEPPTFTDDRGFFSECFQQQRYADAGIATSFVQDNFSRSKKGVIRGLHYQFPHGQGKLIFVIRGAIFDVAVDIRYGSPTFGQHVSFILSDENHHQLYIPPGFAHGICALSDNTDIVYKCTSYYNANEFAGVLYNDPDLGIAWPQDDVVLAPRDLQLPKLADIPTKLLPKYQSMQETAL